MQPGRRYPRRETPASLRLSVCLEAAVPPVWRRIEVASDLGLGDLHDVLQVVFGWEDCHLHRFTTGPEIDPGVAFACTADLAQGFDDDPALPTWDVRVDELLATPGDRLHEQYDYGDNWWVCIEVVDVVEGRVPPGRASLLAGDGAGPPEDCGGLEGYRLMVAASEPSHPDHREALDELEERWGEALTPDAIGLAPFDPITVGHRLAELDLPGRVPVPQQVGEKLVALLLRARDTPTERRLRTLASLADAAVEVDEVRATRMLRPLRVLLDTIGDGVNLTAAGYLPPALVRAVFEELNLDDIWIGKGNREVETWPVLVLRRATQQLGLIRKAKGRLMPTARGRRLGGDPVGPWWELAGRLPVGGRDASSAEWQAGVLLLAHLASGSSTDLHAQLARQLTGLGWMGRGAEPIEGRAVIGLLAHDVPLLRLMGALEHDLGRAWPGTLTDDGVALARAALRTPGT